MDMRDRLVELIINAKRDDQETGSFTDHLADYLIENGVILLPCKPIPLRIDGNPFNSDVYCPVCGTNLSGYYGDSPLSIIQCFNCGEILDNTKALTREEAEKALKDSDDNG